MNDCTLNHLVRRLRAAGLVLAASLLALLTVTATPASAVSVYTHPFLGSFDGSGSLGEEGPTGPFGEISQLTFDESSNSLYVLDTGKGGVIDKFDDAGVPQTFSGLGPGVTSIDADCVPPDILITDITVDNSTASSQGQIYSACSTEMSAFAPSGLELSGNFPVHDVDRMCGITVDRTGIIWRNDWDSVALRRYDATGSYLGESGEEVSGCDLSVDRSGPGSPTSGYFYVASFPAGGDVVQLDAAGNYIKTLFTDAGNNQATPVVARATEVDAATSHVFAVDEDHLSEFDPNGNQIGTFGRPSVGHGFPGGLCGTASGVAVDSPTGKIYVADCNKVDIFGPGQFETFPTVVTNTASTMRESATLRGHVSADGGGDTVSCYFQWDIDAVYENTAPCTEGTVHNGDGSVPVSAPISHLIEGETYHYRLVVSNANGPTFGEDLTFRSQDIPSISELRARDVKSDGAQLIGTLDPRGGHTSYHFEVGTDTSYGTDIPSEDVVLHRETDPEVAANFVTGLTPGTTYHYRIVAENEAGTLVSEDHVFKTFDTLDETIDTCGNAHARRQTNATKLLDCRAYELASARNAGGYDVESDLVPGQQPLPAYPEASGSLLYSLHFGKVPGVAGEPTNFGLDPYVAMRGAGGWSTGYIGIPANSAPSSDLFGSPLAAASSDLGTVAFGGPNICAPCFADGKTGIPVRLPNGTLVQGMAGSIDPGAGVTQSGFVGKQISADGTHLVFASTSQFEPDGNANGDVSVYDRSLISGVTHVVSKTTGGTTMTGPGIGELDISSDGSRVVVGKTTSIDAAGNRYWHLYMNVGDSSHTVDLMPGTATGGLFDGMTADGSKVFFTTSDPLLGSDSDTSADVYQATVDGGGTLTLSRVSTGTSGAGNSDACNAASNSEGPHWNDVNGAADCGAAAFAGGAGIAAGDGTVFFLSPEKLDGSGTAGSPNLFVAESGGNPHFIATLDPDDTSVVRAVHDNELVTRGDIQVTATGEYAVIDTTKSLTGFPNLGSSEVFRYDATTGAVDCVSCALTNAAPSGDTRLSETGLNLTDDGRVFFTTPDQLVLRDTGRKLDAYEWADGAVELISTGTSISNSGLVTVSEDGSDAFFFTRDVLVREDENGSALKIYDARAGGGFPFDAPHVPCQASDECHGAGTVTPPPPPIGTFRGTGGNTTPVKKRRRRAHKHHKKHQKKPSRHGTRRHG